MPIIYVNWNQQPNSSCLCKKKGILLQGILIICPIKAVNLCSQEHLKSQSVTNHCFYSGSYWQVLIWFDRDGLLMCWFDPSLPLVYPPNFTSNSFQLWKGYKKYMHSNINSIGTRINIWHHKIQKKHIQPKTLFIGIWIVWHQLCSNHLNLSIFSSNSKSSHVKIFPNILFKNASCPI